EARPQLERRPVLRGRGLGRRSGHVEVAEIGVRIGEARGDRGREAAVPGLFEPTGALERLPGFVVMTQLVQRDRAVEVRLDVPVVQLERAIELLERFLGTAEKA